jgi:hypothetical protein
MTARDLVMMVAGAGLAAFAAAGLALWWFLA